MYGVVPSSGGDYCNAWVGPDAITTFILYGGTDGPFATSYSPSIATTASSFVANLTLGFVLTK
jgi:hypothetical protein